MELFNSTSPFILSSSEAMMFPGFRELNPGYFRINT